MCSMGPPFPPNPLLPLWGKRQIAYSLGNFLLMVWQHRLGEFCAGGRQSNSKLDILPCTLFSSAGSAQYSGIMCAVVVSVSNNFSTAYV